MRARNRHTIIALDMREAVCAIRRFHVNLAVIGVCLVIPESCVSCLQEVVLSQMGTVPSMDGCSESTFARTKRRTKELDELGGNLPSACSRFDDWAGTDLAAEQRHCHRLGGKTDRLHI
jgi:hypothetical protein